MFVGIFVTSRALACPGQRRAPKVVGEHGRRGDTEIESEIGWCSITQQALRIRGSLRAAVKPWKRLSSCLVLSKSSIASHGISLRRESRCEASLVAATEWRRRWRAELAAGGEIAPGRNRSISRRPARPSAGHRETNRGGSGKYRTSPREKAACAQAIIVLSCRPHEKQKLCVVVKEYVSVLN